MKVGHVTSAAFLAERKAVEGALLTQDWYRENPIVFSGLGTVAEAGLAWRAYRRGRFGSACMHTFFAGACAQRTLDMLEYKSGQRRVAIRSARVVGKAVDRTRAATERKPDSRLAGFAERLAAKAQEAQTRREAKQRAKEHPGDPSGIDLT